MSSSAMASNPAIRLAEAYGGRLPHLIAGALVLFCAAILVEGEVSRWMLRSAGAALASLAVIISWATRRMTARQRAIGGSIETFMENDTSPSFSTDGEGRILVRNRAATARFGASDGDTLARVLRDLFANPAAVLARLQNMVEAGGAGREDLHTPQGHARLSVHQIGRDRFLWRLEDLSDTDGSEDTAAELRLPMLTTNRSGAILSMNGAMRSFLGRPAKTLDQVFRDLPLVSDRVIDVVTAEGERRVRAIALDDAGGRREVFVVPLDGLAATADPAPTDASLDGLPVALLRLSREGCLEAANRQARALLGPAATPGRELHTIVEGLGRSVTDWLGEAAAGRGLGRPEFVRASTGDKELYLQFTLGRVVEDGEIHLVAVLNDATELKTLEAQFVQSQKMQAIGQLAGGVAHDFNNLLTAISGHCDLLMLRHDQGDPDYGDLVQINQNANRAASLVGQLLAFSRKQNLQPEVLDLRDTLSDLTHLLNRLVGEKVTLTLTHDPAMRPIRADKRQLEQVMMNLVVNARDAMPDGGQIRIATEAVRITETLVRDRAKVQPGDYAVVRVIDRGVGIPVDKLTKIFEPFFTTKRTGEGTGLGLSTAYGIVKQTGGYIFVDSVVGEGTTFSLYFPAYETPASVVAAATVAAKAQSFHQGEGVVLLVEDEAPVRAFASRALRLRGYTVLEAENAEEALRILEDDDLAVDVFVTDVVMPGIDGPTWVRMALEKRPDTRVVFVSGYAEESFSNEQARIPNSVFLPKPFSLNELTATVRDQIQ
nr:ATP-binding protein [Tropicimonas sp. IMCC34043]